MNHHQSNLTKLDKAIKLRKQLRELLVEAEKDYQKRQKGVA